MLNTRLVFINGEFVAWEKATVHIMSHSFARGSAIFEVLSLHAARNGPAVFRLEDHIERLFKSAELLDMALPVSPEDFYTAVTDTVKRNALAKGIIKIMCYYPQIAIEITKPQEPARVAVFALDPSDDMEAVDFPGNILERGTTACISKWRKLDPQTVPIQAKAAANYLNGMVARSDAAKRGYEQAIMLDTQGFIAEGGTESVFLVKDGRLMTPALGTVLESITRKSLLQVAEKEGIGIFEGRLPPELLFEADEVFFACTPFKVYPVRRIEDRVLEDMPGPLTRQIADVIDRIADGHDERFDDWLFAVD